MGIWNKYENLVNKAYLWAAKRVQAQARTRGQYTYGTQTEVERYTAEKNPGELGTIKKYYLDHQAVANRAWQSYLESDVVQAIVQKMTSWVAGRGLKIEPTPIKDFLKDNQIIIDENFSKKAQQNFEIFKNSKSSVYGQNTTLNKKSVTAYLNAFVGGDFLVVLHIKKNRLQVECIDMQHIYSPTHSDATKDLKKGNVIKYGIEVDPSGEHIAYYVKKRKGHKRVPAKSSTGLRVAYMVYSNLEYRYSNDRGLSELAAILESVKKLDRYREAAVGGAEERAKIAYTIEHNSESTGINPLGNQLKGSVRANAVIEGGNNTPEDGAMKAANNFAATTGKQAVNMPIGASAKALSSDMELNFKDFYMTNLQIACAAVDIPIEVALSKFESSFSSSRGAMKMFERTIDYKRSDWAEQFWKPIYTVWLYLEELRSDINAPGFFEAVSFGNDMIVEAYVSMKMTGPKMPHVDPVKEVEAVRRKLGKKAENVPLMSIAEAIEEVGGNIDFSDFSDKFLDEVSDFIEESAPTSPPITGKPEEGVIPIAK